MLVHDKGGPYGDQVRQINAHGRAPDGTRGFVVGAGEGAFTAAQLMILADVVEKQIDRRLRELSRPIFVRHLELDVDVLGAELFLPLLQQQLFERIIDVLNHDAPSVQRSTQPRISHSGDTPLH